MDLALALPAGFILLLIIISGFFSGSETGLTAASKAKIHALKQSGNKNAVIAEKLLNSKERLIGTILLGNNAVNILASSLATSITIGYFGDGAVLYVTVILTMLILIFAEVLPKTYAVQNAEKVSLKAAPIMAILVKVLAPITATVQVGVSFLLRSTQNLEPLENNLDELRGTIELHHHEGQVVKHDRDMLGSILDLSNTEVHSVMIHRKNIQSIDVSTPIQEIIDYVLSSNHTRIPIWQDKPENIVGVLHAKKLLSEFNSFNGNQDKLDILQIANEPWFIPETTNLNDQLLRFRQRHNHMAIVVDEYGDLVGLLTLEDILEEIVGQIYDEYDIVAQGIKRIKGGKLEVKGEVTIRDLNRAMDWNLPDNDASTIAGLVIHHAENIPEVGQEFEFLGFKFKIIQRHNQQITGILIEKSPKE